MPITANTANLRFYDLVFTVNTPYFNRPKSMQDYSDFRLSYITLLLISTNTHKTPKTLSRHLFNFKTSPYMV